ncbi:hypothetical protein P5673_024112 [Acropora cervicornis]|uniref:Uncharacterized protein n=1 Tax=Acropora cervicornis TaxID=6130 RepID=A0AAD9UYM6_ACRCE|nr:hypothetical protein P5673_024112 [Acropora cervicornis]
MNRRFALSPSFKRREGVCQRFQNQSQRLRIGETKGFQACMKLIPEVRSFHNLQIAPTEDGYYVIYAISSGVKVNLCQTAHDCS